MRINGTTVIDVLLIFEARHMPCIIPGNALQLANGVA